MDIHYTYLVVQHGDRIWHQPWADGTGVYLYYCGGTHRSGVFCRADPNIAAGVFPLKIAGKPALKGLSQNDLKKLISAFEIVINALSPESQVIINNEFILKKDNDWWNEYYSRATYYRMKTRALEEILFYVNIS